MKTCKKCGLVKPFNDFHNQKQAKDGKQSLCKPCNIARVRQWQDNNPKRFENYWREQILQDDYLLKRRASRYGLTAAELSTKIEESLGLCEICKREPTKPLVVDHCHNTSQVRGMLCGPCNRGLGIFEDSTELLQNAITYLEKYKRL